MPLYDTRVVRLKAVVYFDIRVKKEKLDEEKLATEMGLLNNYAKMDGDVKETKTTTKESDTSDNKKELELV